MAEATNHGMANIGLQVRDVLFARGFHFVAATGIPSQAALAVGSCLRTVLGRSEMKNQAFRAPLGSCPEASHGTKIHTTRLLLPVSLTRFCAHASINFSRALGMESVTTPLISELRKTALNTLHRRLGAKMVNFGGWDMAVEYPSSGGLIAEHKAVRGSVGVFDVSHMGDIRIRSGKKPGGALAAVQHISMSDASKLAIGQAHYSAMLYPEGTFVDDVIVHRLGEDDFLLVINAGTREKDINWVR